MAYGKLISNKKGNLSNDPRIKKASPPPPIIIPHYLDSVKRKKLIEIVRWYYDRMDVDKSVGILTQDHINTIHAVLGSRQYSDEISDILNTINKEYKAICKQEHDKKIIEQNTTNHLPILDEENIRVRDKEGYWTSLTNFSKKNHK